MSKPVRLDVEAQEELDAAVSWYDAQTERADVGNALLDEVNDALQRIAAEPLACALAPGAAAQRGVRRCMLRRFPYALVFLELETEIRVLAMAHMRRRPGYWRSRV